MNQNKTIALFHDIYYYWLNKEVWNEAKKKKFIQISTQRYFE